MALAVYTGSRPRGKLNLPRASAPERGVGAYSVTMVNARIAVFGPYKTGTTGLYSKILHSLPADVPVRTLFEPSAYTPESADAERVLLAKVILRMPEDGDGVDYASFAGFDRRVRLVRDPRDWLVSGTLFVIQQNRAVYGDDRVLEHVLGLLVAKEADPRGLSLVRLLTEILAPVPGQSFAQITDWIGRQLDWLVDHDPALGEVHETRYEDFVAGRLATLEDYLGLPLTGSATPEAAYDHVPRTLAAGHWRHWFTDEDVRVFRPIFQRYMRHYRYPDDWTLAPAPVISPEHATRYVRRVVAKRRAAENLPP